MPPDRPIAFTSEQIRELIDAARALPVTRRGAYLEIVAEQLRGRGIAVTGDVRRAAIAAVRQVREG
jgi:hypothetical protein